MAITYRSISSRVIAAADKKPGASELLYYALHHEPTTWGTILNDGTPGSTKRVVTAFVFPQNGGFKTIQAKAKSIEPTADAQGEAGGQLLTYKYKIIIKGDSPEIAEFFENFLNEDSVMLFNDPQCGVDKLIQLGSKCSPVQISGAVYRGGTKGNGGFKEFEFVAESTDRFFYEAIVPMAVEQAVLDTPENLAITATTANSIDISWDAVATATSYEVQYSTSADFAAPSVQTVAAPTVVASITGLTASTTYYIRVRAKLTGAINSSWATISATTA